MPKTLDKAKIRKVADFLKRIDRGDDVRGLATSVRRISEDVSPVELAAAGRILFDEGYAPTIVNHLLAAFSLIGKYVDRSGGPKDYSQHGHILQRVSAEHALFRCLAAELSEIAVRLRAAPYLSDTMVEYGQFTHVVSHFSAMKEHFEREDDVILPYLRRIGWTGLCAVATNDHAQLGAQIDCLTSLVTEPHTLSPDDLQSSLVDCVGRFCACLLEHLSFEDSVLWPLALVVIDDPAVWTKIKTVCQEIGYCGIHVT